MIKPVPAQKKCSRLRVISLEKKLKIHPTASSKSVTLYGIQTIPRTRGSGARKLGSVYLEERPPFAAISQYPLDRSWSRGCCLHSNLKVLHQTVACFHIRPDEIIWKTSGKTEAKRGLNTARTIPQPADHRSRPSFRSFSAVASRPHRAPHVLGLASASPLHLPSSALCSWRQFPSNYIFVET